MQEFEMGCKKTSRPSSPLADAIGSLALLMVLPALLFSGSDAQ